MVEGSAAAFWTHCRAHVLRVRSVRQAYSAEVATKAGRACGLPFDRLRTGRTSRLREGMLCEQPPNGWTLGLPFIIPSGILGALPVYNLTFTCESTFHSSEIQSWSFRWFSPEIL